MIISKIRLYTQDNASEINPYDNDLLPPTVSFPFGPEDAPTPNPSTNAASSATDIEGNLDGDDSDLCLLQSAYEAVEVLSYHHTSIIPFLLFFNWSRGDTESDKVSAFARDNPH